MSAPSRPTSSTRGRGRPTAGSIETRLARAGLPPLPRTAWLEVDLDALLANLATIRRYAGAGVPVQPVVKADAYGHGAIPVARALQAAGVEGFCVATYDEAVALRKAGIRRPILVLYPVPVAWATEAARRRIAVTAGDMALLEASLAAVTAAHRASPATPAGPAGTSRASRPLASLRIQLEVETGLGRGGLQPPELLEAAIRIEAALGARLDGLWTHLQAAEDKPGTSAQLARFEAATQGLREAGIRLPRRHVAASGALVQDGVVAYDGVRPGLSLYGLVPDELLDVIPAAVARALRPVMALHARPVRVADLPAGWGISYGPTFRTNRPSRIATLPLGYGDGWPRSLSNAAEALVRGRRVPLVGTVAMDAIMADVTDVPGRPVTPDDEFVLLGRQGGAEISAAELARRRTTNSWETVTSMAWRLPRVYHARSGPEGIRTLVSGGIG
ncbi:MAG: alanine racemase [Chloroflexota bacterium]|nr:MAG: alanine racemase [Chloroflexota bacterium]